MLKRYWWSILVGVGVVLLDQVTKWIINARLFIHESIYITSFCNITHIRNKGAAFGLLSAAPDGFRDVFFVAISIVAIVVVIFLLVKTEQRQSMRSLSFSFILGGALGNLIDRIRFKEVIDFLDLHLGPHHWPAFNAADSAITVGVIILVIQLFFEPKGVDRGPTS